MRLVEMLIERGAEQVIAFDVVPRDRVYGAWSHPRIEWVTGDISNPSDVDKCFCKGADCVWHLAAAVGPFHKPHVYRKVNYEGTINVIAACKAYKIPKLVFSSSPSTRFRGSLWRRPNIDGATEDGLPPLPLTSYMQRYAETKAMGEMAVSAVVNDGSGLLVVSVAPHQVYGPRDNQFLPNVLEAAGTGKLRPFGTGGNRVCFTHVDNYAHGLILAERQLYPGSTVLGKFYIVTDGQTHSSTTRVSYVLLWEAINQAVVGVGFQSLSEKWKLSFPFLYVIALMGEIVAWILGVTFKLNVFNVFVMTMHRWFKIDAAERDLKYTPIIPFEEGWRDTIDWFRICWRPAFDKEQEALSRAPFLQRWLGIHAKTQAKIDVHNLTTDTDAKKQQ